MSMEVCLSDIVSILFRLVSEKSRICKFCRFYLSSLQLVLRAALRPLSFSVFYHSAVLFLVSLGLFSP